MQDMKKNLLSIVGLMFSIVAFAVDGNLRKQGDWEHHYTSYTYAGLPIKSVHVHTANGERTIQENYSYDYDHVGRLVKTTYGINGSPDKVLSSLDYDDLGRVFTQTLLGKESVAYLYNIRNRKTDIIGQNFNQSLAYNHSNGSLIPRKSLYNGNMVSDKNKGIGSISYDINNQPREISFSDGRKSSYVYDSEGRKHSVSYNLTAMTSAQPLIPVMQSANVVSGNTTNGLKNIQYCDNIIYDDGETIVLNDIGYAKYDRQGNLSFHYYLQDHLGNNRVVMNEDGTIEQVNDYYPTGALMGSSQNGEVQRYKYNGKELDRLNGLDWYDYGARNYDATLVVWNGVDKLGEKYAQYSPFCYCDGNFINNFDSDGNSSKSKFFKGLFKLSKNVSKNGFKALANTETYYEAFGDISEDTKTVFDENASTLDRITAGIHAVSEIISVAEDGGKSFRNIKLRKTAEIGQEAHRQIEKELKKQGADVEVTVDLKGKTVRKDAIKTDGTAVIIKPNTKSGHRLVIK
jgi:RHS repeat-associated protein